MCRNFLSSIFLSSFLAAIELLARRRLDFNGFVATTRRLSALVEAASCRFGLDVDRLPVPSAALRPCRRTGNAPCGVLGTMTPACVPDSQMRHDAASPGNGLCSATIRHARLKSRPRTD